MKNVLLVLLALSSFSAFAQECASNTQELRALVGNADLSLNWVEKTDTRPITITVSDASENLKLTMAGTEGELAKVNLEICRNGSDYRGIVKKIVWGPSVPGIIRNRSINSFKIKFIYQTEMKISWFVSSFVFEAK